MNDRLFHNLSRQVVSLLAGLTLLLLFGVAYAGNDKEDKPTLPLPPSQEELTVLKTRFKTARKDIEAFYIFADNFHKNGDSTSLEQLQKPVDEFLSKHVNNLLKQSLENKNLETVRMAAEIMFIKALLFQKLDRKEAATNVVSELKDRFAAYQNISVNLPGKTTTLDEGIRSLGGDFVNTEKTKKE
jgi:hypothetical protein